MLRAFVVERISGVKRSSTPFPEGPFKNSYAGCLSDQAVRPPAWLMTLKMLLTRTESCGYTGVQPLAGLNGSDWGLIPPAFTALVLWSMVLSLTTAVPSVPH